MASSGNTWCKKNMARAKRNMVREQFGDQGRFYRDGVVVDRQKEASFFVPYTPSKKLTCK